MSAPESGNGRPVLAIVHGEGSVSAMQLAGAASSAAYETAWVVDCSEPDTAKMARLLRRFGTVVDVAGLSSDDAAAALATCRPAGIVAYFDRQIPTAAALATRLGLDYHDEIVAERLTDKVVQRRALAAGGVPVPKFLAVPPRPAAPDVEQLARQVCFPVIVKPRHGASSRDTVLAEDFAGLDHALRGPDAPAGDDHSTMVVEELIVGSPPGAVSEFADYVSVESVVTRGSIGHVAVTGRLWPTEPFRETGLFISSDIAPALSAEVLDLAARAIDALGARTGCFHTEIKMSPDGPRLLEVNGRLGGGVPDMLSRAAGVDLLEVSQRLAMGEAVHFPGLLPTNRVGYLVYVHPPMWARTVNAVAGLESLRACDGVDTVTLHRRPGDAVDWRQGSNGFVLSVSGSVPDHASLASFVRFLEDNVMVDYADE